MPRFRRRKKGQEGVESRNIPLDVLTFESERCASPVLSISRPHTRGIKAQTPALPPAHTLCEVRSRSAQRTVLCVHSQFSFGVCVGV